jgi:hypothetical protein
MRPIYNKVFNRDGSTNSGQDTKSYAKGPPLYPKLRTGNFSHDNTISHGDFERLGPIADEMSLETLNQKGHKEDVIHVRTSVEQIIV